MKKIITFLAIIGLVLSLGACSSDTDTEQGDNSNDAVAQQLIIATGGTSGTYYPLGGGIAQIITDNTSASATAQSTGASVENMRLLQKQDVDLAFTQTDIADYATKAVKMFDGNAVDNLTGVASLYYETIQIVVPENSDINSVADLAGKKVSTGAPGSGVEANAEQILEVYGLTFDDLKAEHLSFGDSTSKIQDGNLDAAFLTAGAPTSAVTELSATKGVKLIALDADKIAQLVESYPFYVEQTIPADTYPGVSEVNTVAVKAMLVARAGLSDELVYDITKALFENTNELVLINAKAKAISLESAAEGMSLDIHPGALKYYQEEGIIQ